MSGTLPTWMERWLGLSNGPGMGTTWRLDFHWSWPFWPTFLGLVALVAAIVGIYLLESRQARLGYRLGLAAVRLLLLGLVLLMIAQPKLFLQRTGLPFVVVIIDDTRSMNTVDQDVRKSLEERVAKALPAAKPLKGPATQSTGPLSRVAALSRWNLARTLFVENDGELLTALADSHKLRFYYLSEMKESRRTDVPGIVEELRAAEAKGDSTRLGLAVRGALDELRGTTPAAVVLATDGINTEGPGLLDAAAYSRSKGVPLLLIGVGGRPARNLNLGDLEVEDVVFVNDLVPFNFKLTATGFAGKKVSIVLRRQGAGSTEQGAGSRDSGSKLQAPSGQIVGRIEVTVAADGRAQEVVLTDRPAQTGQFRYTIDVESPPGDLHIRPQPLTCSVRVREEKVRVLLVEGSPRFEYRFLRNLLGRDKTIELHTLLQDADMDSDEAGEEAGDADKNAATTDGGKMLKVFPVDAKGLSAYDVVIFGDVNPSLLSPSALENLADFVDRRDRGGALVLLAGPNFMPQAYRDTPLARLMPFDPAKVQNPQPDKPLVDGFVLQPTEMGLASPAMQLGDSPKESRDVWQKLPPLYWMTEVSELKPSARVLAEHPARVGGDGKRLPLIVMQYVGHGGKVLFHAVDETYRWRRRQGDRYFARYWIQTLRYLSRWKLAEGGRTAEGECPARLSSNRGEYPSGDPVRLQVHFSDDRLAPLDDNGVIVELEQVGRQTQKVQLHRGETGRGHFEAVLNNLPAGDYHAKMISPALPALPDRGSALPAVNFRVKPPQSERTDVAMDATEMRQAAELTKGHYYSYDEASHLIDDLPVGRPVPVENLPSLPLWNCWPLLALILVLLIGEWLLRKRKGMA